VLFRSRQQDNYLYNMAHGGLAQAGKVKGRTPKVEPAADKRKKPQGRAGKRAKASSRFNVSVAQRRLGPNHGAGRKEEDIKKN